MMKMLDKTNIDFIGPRYICMAASVIVIALGLAAFFADRGRDDVQHRLHRRHPGHDPAERGRPRGQGALRVAARRPTSARRPSVLPDVTVESLKVGDENGRLSGSTSGPPTRDVEHVKTEIVKAFGPPWHGSR